MNVLVDTSVWSLALRRRQQQLNAREREIVAELAELIDEGRAKIIGLVRQEVLSGMKNSAQFAKLRDILRSFPDEPIETSDHETAALMGNQCRAAGLAISAPDMLICAVARSRVWSIFSTDPDFRRYASPLHLNLHAVRG